MKVFKKFLILNLLLFMSVFAQSTNRVLFKPVVNVGSIFSGTTSWIFTMDNQFSSKSYSENLSPMKLGYSYGFGIEVLQLSNFYGANLNALFNYSYGRASTGKIITISGEAEFNFTSIPIMFWTILKSDSRLRPFLEIGLGHETMKIEETYFDYPDTYDFSLEMNQFAWGLGAGLEFDVTKQISISLYGDAIIKENGFVEELDYGRSINYGGRNASFFGGFIIGYTFN